MVIPERETVCLREMGVEDGGMRSHYLCMW